MSARTCCTTGRDHSRAISSKDFEQKYTIELECMMCGEKAVLTGYTKMELKEVLKEEGWRYLISHKYGSCGYWCGCDYKDNY